MEGGARTYSFWYSWISPTGYELSLKNMETGIRGGSDWTGVAFFFFLGFFFSAERGRNQSRGCGGEKLGMLTLLLLCEQI